MAVIFPDEIHPKYRLRLRFEHFARANQYLEHFNIVVLYPSYIFNPLDLKFNSIGDLDEFLFNRGIVYHEFDVSDTYPYIKKEFTIVDARMIYHVEERILKYLLNYKFYSINEIGEMLSFSRPTIYKIINEGKLKTIRINGQMRIKHIDLTNYINNENQPSLNRE